MFLQRHLEPKQDETARCMIEFRLERYRDLLDPEVQPGDLPCAKPRSTLMTNVNIAHGVIVHKGRPRAHLVKHRV